MGSSAIEVPFLLKADPAALNGSYGKMSWPLTLLVPKEVDFEMAEDRAQLLMVSFPASSVFRLMIFRLGITCGEVVYAGWSADDGWLVATFNPETGIMGVIPVGLERLFELSEQYGRELPLRF